MELKNIFIFVKELFGRFTYVSCSQASDPQNEKKMCIIPEQCWFSEANNNGYLRVQSKSGIGIS